MNLRSIFENLNSEQNNKYTVNDYLKGNDWQPQYQEHDKSLRAQAIESATKEFGEIEPLFEDPESAPFRGSSRDVFKIKNHPHKILKMAKNGKGKAQNGEEYRVWWSVKDARILCPLHEPHDKNFLWLVAEKAEDVTEDDFQRYFGLSLHGRMMPILNRLKNAFDKKLKPEYQQQELKNIEETWSHVCPEFFKNFYPLFINLFKKQPTLNTPDMNSLAQWGKIRNGNIVLVDYGLTDKMSEFYY